MPDALGDDGVRIHSLLFAQFGPATADLFVFCGELAAKYGEPEARKALKLAVGFSEWVRTQVEVKH